MKLCCETNITNRFSLIMRVTRNEYSSVCKGAGLRKILNGFAVYTDLIDSSASMGSQIQYIRYVYIQYIYSIYI